MLQQGKARPKKAPSKKKATPARGGKTDTKKVSSRSGKTTPILITSEQRQQMIEEAAYFIAERRGFAVHDCLDCWLAAEAEIDQQLSQSAV